MLHPEMSVLNKYRASMPAKPSRGSEYIMRPDMNGLFELNGAQIETQYVLASDPLT